MQNASVKKFSDNKIKKFIIVVITVLFLLIPIAFINGIIKDRQNYKSTAIDSVAVSWANAQWLYAPEMYFNQKNGDKTETKYLKLNNYDVNVVINTEMRKKGIFKVPVYTADVTLKGDFINKYGSLLGKKLIIDFEVKDSTGFISDPIFNIMGEKSQISHETKLEINNDKNVETVPFEISYKLRGLNELYVVPKGQNNIIHIEGNWKDPSFNGDFLPFKRDIQQDKFTADWSIPGIALSGVKSSYEDESVYASSYKTIKAGVSLLVPVDNYRMSERVLKYALLFLALTFFSYFIFEITSKENKRIHPIQYCLMGGAMLIFYLLLVSLSEFLPFLISYIISAAMIIILISSYTYFVITKRDNPLFSYIITALLTILYAFLYILLQMQDFALLIGSIGLFIIMALVMYITRNVNWYQDEE